MRGKRGLRARSWSRQASAETLDQDPARCQMRNSLSRRVLAVLAVLVAVLCALVLFDWLRASADSRGPITPTPGSALGVAPPALIQVADPEHLIREPVTGTVRLVARSDTGVPVDGADVFVVQQDSPYRDGFDGAVRLGTTGLNGEVELALQAISTPQRHSLIVVWKRGYEAAVAPVKARDAETVYVTLARCHSLHVVVTESASDAKPVPGVAVAVATVELPTTIFGNQAITNITSGWTRGGQPSRVWCGVTDSDGAIHFDGLAAGRYYITCNQNSKPFVLSNIEKCLFADVPGEPVTIVVDPVYAAILECIGDETVAAAAALRGPFRLVDPLEGSSHVTSELRRLQAAFPSAHVFAGAVRGFHERMCIDITVYAKASGWHVVSVPLQRTLGVAATTKHTLPSGAQDTTADVVLQFESSIAFDSGWVATMVFESPTRPIGIDLVPGKSTRVPRSKFRLIPGGALPRSAFASLKGHVDDVAGRRLTVPCSDKLWKYCMSISSPEGVPRHAGVSLSGDGLGVTSMMHVAEGGLLTFWSTAGEHAYHVHIKGFAAVGGIIRRGLGEMGPLGESFSVRVSERIK